jgi:hypothetical protein
MWNSRLILILSIVSGTALATPQHSRMCPDGQLLRSLSDGPSVTLPERVYAKCHGMILTSMMGLRWASMIFPFIEQRMIIDGELIQISSEKRTTPSAHSSYMASSRIASLGGSGREGGTVGLREGFVKGSLD